MVKRTAAIISVLLAMPFLVFPQERGPRESHSSSPPLAKTEAERKILAVLDEMVKSRQTYLNVRMADGKALRLLAESADAKRIAEIGTSTGYSGLWFCLALEGTGGHLTTFEINHGRALLARNHFQQAGVEKLVTIVEGNAHETIARLKGPIDVAFIDADKEGYVDYLKQLLPLVRPGGLILAHNVDMVPDYVKAVTTNADLETIFYMEGAGLVDDFEEEIGVGPDFVSIICVVARQDAGKAPDCPAERSIRVYLVTEAPRSSASIRMTGEGCSMAIKVYTAFPRDKPKHAQADATFSST